VQLSITIWTNLVPNNLLRLVWLFQKIDVLITEFDVYGTFTTIRRNSEGMEAEGRLTNEILQVIDGRGAHD